MGNVNTLSDLDYEDIDVGVRVLVRRLRAKGFDTCDSGDGTKTGMGCARDHAHVTIQVKPDDLVSEARRLRDEVGYVGVFRLGPIGSGGWSIQATYDPCDESAFIDLRLQPSGQE
jgi:hypothetical protein